MFLNNQFFESLICPSSKKKLSYKSNYLYSDNFKYPVINNIPILINEDNSLFKIDDFKEKNNIHYNLNKTPIISFVKSFFPSISLNLKSKANYKRISKMLDKSSKILIVGGSIKGDGIQSLYNNHNNIIEGDVHFGPQTKIIFDAHDIPFEDQSFDCIIIQAVLEHVVDPMKCVNEIYRVLSKNGIVYSETPFMQQVHMRAYDFTRFTYLGHRRLFRKFKLIDSGPCCGPGMVFCIFFKKFYK